MTTSAVFKRTRLFTEGNQESIYQPNKRHSFKRNNFLKTKDAKRLTDPIELRVS